MFDQMIFSKGVMCWRPWKGSTIILMKWGLLRWHSHEKKLGSLIPACFTLESEPNLFSQSYVHSIDWLKHYYISQFRCEASKHHQSLMIDDALIFKHPSKSGQIKAYTSIFHLHTQKAHFTPPHVSDCKTSAWLCIAEEWQSLWVHVYSTCTNAQGMYACREPTKFVFNSTGNNCVPFCSWTSNLSTHQVGASQLAEVCRVQLYVHTAAATWLHHLRLPSTPPVDLAVGHTSPSSKQRCLWQLCSCQALLFKRLMLVLQHQCNRC